MSLLPFPFSLSFTICSSFKYISYIRVQKKKKPETYLYFDGNGNKLTLYY